LEEARENVLGSSREAMLTNEWGNTYPCTGWGGGGSIERNLLRKTDRGNYVPACSGGKSKGHGILGFRKIYFAKGKV